mmetsp:Transcript_15367/g.38108  ORF Transcript_15367/g.38108 Transcript_15367/m.38108 type:complete len:242 (+) Transcript_15367:2958-3683(+)
MLDERDGTKKEIPHYPRRVSYHPTMLPWIQRAGTLDEVTPRDCITTSYQPLPNADQPTEVQSCTDRNGYPPGPFPWTANPSYACRYQNRDSVQEICLPQELPQVQVRCHCIAVPHPCQDGQEVHEEPYGRTEGHRKITREQRAPEDGNEQSQGHACRSGKGGRFQLGTHKGIGCQTGRNRPIGEACCRIGEKARGRKGNYCQVRSRPSVGEGKCIASRSFYTSRTRSSQEEVLWFSGPRCW